MIIKYWGIENDLARIIDVVHGQFIKRCLSCNQPKLLKLGGDLFDTKNAPPDFFALLVNI